MNSMKSDIVVDSEELILCIIQYKFNTVNSLLFNPDLLTLVLLLLLFGVTEIPLL